MSTFQVICADVIEGLRQLPDESVNCCVTSPPYWGLRDYGVAGQIGLERTPEAYVARLVAVFREVRRVLNTDGTCWLNLGDSYFCSTRGSGGDPKPGSKLTGGRRTITSGQMFDPIRIDGSGLKPKDIIGIPWRVAFALQADGWWLRSEIIWSKPNPMPESVTDRPTKAHEQVFLLAKSERYFYDADVIAEQSLGLNAPSWEERKTLGEGPRRTFSQNAPVGCHRVGGGETRNKRSVWTISTQPFPEAHFAVMPEALVEPCILAGCPEGGTVLDPFVGSGTVGVVALKSGRNFIGTELNPEYVAMANRRLHQVAPMFHEEACAQSVPSSAFQGSLCG